MTTDQLQELLSVAEKAAELRPGRWEVHDSNSWRRIGSAMPYSDGDVICPVTQRDGHPDLRAEREVLDHVATFDPTTCAELVREVMRLRQEIADYEQTDLVPRSRWEHTNADWLEARQQHQDLAKRATAEIERLEAKLKEQP